MSQYCPTCDVGWWPHQTTKGGLCPECGKGTKFRKGNGDADAAARFIVVEERRRARDEAKARELAFEEFCVEREMRRNGLDRLPLTDPQEAA